MRRTHASLWLLVLVCLFALGCGPVKSTLMIRDAEDVLHQARQEEADQKLASTYFYWAAHEYLIKAKTSHGRAEFFSSEEQAARSLELGKMAIEKSKGATLRVVDPEAVRDQYPWIVRTNIDPEPPVELPPPPKPEEKAPEPAPDKAAGSGESAAPAEAAGTSPASAEETDTP